MSKFVKQKGEFLFKVSTNIVKRTYILSDHDFNWVDGPDMPVNLAGHCLLNIGNGKLFLHGGVTEAFNANTTNLKVSTKTWILENSTWTELKIRNQSGCSLHTKIDLNWKTQCESRHYDGKTEIVVFTFYEPFESTCTNIIDLNTFHMHKVVSQLQPPFGGYFLQ